MVKRFRTKIVEIEAVQFTGDNLTDMVMFTGVQNFRNTSGPYVAEDGSTLDVLIYSGEVFDKLHDTWIKVAPGQWIVRGAKGEFYPCDDETFHWKYEEVV